MNVFVYGSLLRGQSNHGILAHCTLVAEAKTLPQFTLYDLGYFPGLVLGGTQAVRGEIYEVPDSATLRALDRLEGHPHFYYRQPVTLRGERKGQQFETVAQTYLLQDHHVVGRPRIMSGDWRHHLKERRRCELR